MAKYREPALVVLLALLLAAVTQHVMALIYGDFLRRSILTGLYLLEGKPHWRLFQNRVLGPFVERAMMHASGNSEIGFVLFDILCFGTAFVLAWRIGLRIVGNRAGALAAMLTLVLSLVTLFMPEWFYAWDVSGIALYMVLAWLVVTDAAYGWIFLLFVIAIFNRDDALFIGLLLTIRPAVDWWRARRDPARPAFAWRPAVLGVICMIGGVAVMSLLRRLLLVEEQGPKLFGPPRDHTAFFQWDIHYNFHYVFHVMPWLALELPPVVLVPPLIITAACVWLAFARGGRYLSYALMNLAMVAATLAFGIIFEIRIWVDLLPPVVVATSLALAWADEDASRL